MHVFTPQVCPLFSNKHSVGFTQNQKSLSKAYNMGWVQRSSHLGLVNFSWMRCDFLKHFFLCLSIVSQVPLIHLFILLHGLHGNTTSLCAFILQPSFSFFYFSFSFSSFFVYGRFPFLYSTMGLWYFSYTSCLLFSLLTTPPT